MVKYRIYTIRIYTIAMMSTWSKLENDAGEYLNDEDKDDNRVENKIADNEEVELEERGKKKAGKIKMKDRLRRW